MPGFSISQRQAILNAFASGNMWVAMLSTAPSADDGTGLVEVSGNGYARVATTSADWAAATSASPSILSNSVALTFPTSTGAWAAGAGLTAFALFSAVTGGTFLCWDYAGSDNWQPFTISAGASPAVLEAPAHGLANGNSIAVTNNYGGVLPAGGTWTGLLTVAGVTTDTLTAGVNTTGSGSGLLRRVEPLVVGSSGITPSYGIGALQIVL